MIEVYKNSKIYIVTYPNFESGGPELLHQLCRELNELGFDARMYYDGKPQIGSDPVPNKFKKYNTKYVTHIEDDPKNILIFPEAIEKTAKENSKIRKVMWWLGVNHYLIYSELQKYPKLAYLKHWCSAMLNKRPSYTFRQLRNNDIQCLAQCWFIISYLNQKGVKNVPYLSDYISEDFITFYNEKNPAEMKKENIVLYNPSRNTKYVEKIMKAAPDIEFVPLKGLDSQKLKEIMSKAKIYVDFGNHPGKDRMPRETAIMGCCVLTSYEGSAGFYNDLPIPDEYKFEREHKNISLIVQKIRYIFENYEKEKHKYDYYREFILKEKNKFRKNISELFIKPKD